MLAPQPLAAQFDAITALFKEVHSITLYSQGTRTSDPIVGGECAVSGILCGVGTEVLIDVAGSEGRHVELGLGAAYLTGLTSESNGLEFNAGVRSFPTISAYLVGLPLWDQKVVEGYAGASIGVIELQNAQTYDEAGVERGVTGSTFEFGLIGGLYHGRGPFGVFAETSYRVRRFASLDYTLTEGDSGKVPGAFPRELDLSGFTVAIGVQFRLKEDEDTSLPMLLTLTRVDAQPLPAVVQAVTERDGTVRQWELLFGTLTLTPKTSNGKPDTTGTYIIELQSRQLTLTSSGETGAIQPPAVTPAAPPPALSIERGSYVIASDKLSLDPEGAAPEYQALRMGDEIRVRHIATGYGLVFGKPGAAPPAKKKDEDDS
jgi:hypothetical protein